MDVLTESRSPRRMSGAAAALSMLERAGVKLLFGIPGGANLPLYQTLSEFPGLRHILTRHEQGAGHAASGHAQATGTLGVCLATSGPGATNLVTALMDAHMDSVPVLAITGQVDSSQLGTAAFQEADICSIVAPITKYAVEVTRATDVADAVGEAIRCALSGRPGPALVSITKDALAGTVQFVPASWPDPCPAEPPQPTPALIERAAELLLAAKRPVLYVGGGVIKADAAAPLRELAETLDVPVVTTLMARGAFPDTHRQHLGMPGMHGTVAAVAALQAADLVIAAGARFDDRVTGKLDSFAPRAAVVHIDIDNGELNRKRRADVALHADCHAALTALTDQVRRSMLARTTSRGLGDWWERLDSWRSRYPQGYQDQGDGLMPQYVIERLGVLTAGPGTVYTTGVGQHQMWASQFIQHNYPRAFVNSGGAGTMGYALPAALGVQAALPDAEVWAIDGDGSFAMTCQELATCVHADLPVKVAVLNNASLGMVRQWQDLFHEQNFVETDLDSPAKPPSPDITALARAYGCAVHRCDHPEEVDRAVLAASAIRDRPTVIEFVVSKSAMVWPMVPPGVSNDEIEIARGLRPHF
ncbi:biosynthetic-type acetolactate synthase large subunit [Streptomyces alfalfae]|uniref:biosynthetic-type acetolactate synthase large subunit n=1 Tax=Streptomyces alfalfae TaxID=1642299 RepID=UPI001BACEE01|nr:biosynthetic-type acetolactate synthase large subunit [Streptomyces alfalfae]